MSFWVVSGQPKDRLTLNTPFTIQILSPSRQSQDTKLSQAWPSRALHLLGQDVALKAPFGRTLYCANAMLLELAES